MFLDLLAGGGLLAAGYVVGYLTARTVHRRSAGQEDCTCGHSVSVHDQSGAPSRSSVRSNGKSTGSRSTGAMWHVPASGTSAPGVSYVPEIDGPKRREQPTPQS